MRLLGLMAALACVLAAATPTKLAPVDEANYATTLAALKGKTVLVNFWATWCEPCRKEMPELAKMAASLAAKGFVLVTISADEAEDEKTAIGFLEKAGFKGPAYLKRAKDDDKFINLVDPKWSGALPALMLYDKTGKKAKAWTGEADLKEVKAAIQKLL